MRIALPFIFWFESVIALKDLSYTRSQKQKIHVLVSRFKLLLIFEITLQNVAKIEQDGPGEGACALSANFVQTRLWHCRIRQVSMWTEILSSHLGLQRTASFEFFPTFPRDHQSHSQFNACEEDPFRLISECSVLLLLKFLLYSFLISRVIEPCSVHRSGWVSISRFSRRCREGTET